MEIVFVVTNAQRKSLVFVSDELETYSLGEAVQLTRNGKVEGAHVVTKNNTSYIRTTHEPNDRGIQIMEEFSPLAKQWLK